MWMEAEFWILNAGRLSLTMHSVAQNTGGVGISVMILLVTAEVHLHPESTEQQRLIREMPGRPWLPLFRQRCEGEKKGKVQR